MTAVPNNITLTKDGIQVTLATTRVEEIWSKTLTPITTPITTSGRDIETGANDTKIVDLLLKAEKRFSVDGRIHTDFGDTDTSYDAYDKKEDLKKIVYAGGTIIMNWESEDYEVGINKMTINWASNDKDKAITSYVVKFTCIVGVDF